MQVHRTTVVFAVLATLLAVGGWAAHRLYGTAEPAVFAARGDGRGWSLMGAAKSQADAPAASASAPRSAAAVREQLFTKGSFADTQLDGDWAIGPDGKPQPSIQLRRRFENYLLALGEATLPEIRSLVEDDARRAHGDVSAAAILAVWDKYMQLRQHDFQRRFDQSDRATWRPFFEELKAVRRQILGRDWAQAFFAAEEAEFEQFVAQLESGQPAPPDPGAPVPQIAPGKDAAAVRAERVARYGEAAAQRLEQADAEWADWERRLQAGSTEWTRLKQSPELSDAQRRELMDRYIAANFQPDEHRRVRALLDL